MPSDPNPLSQKAYRPIPGWSLLLFLGATPLIGLLVFLAYIRWGLAYSAARVYARHHAACIPNDQVRVLTTEGIEARCTTSTATVGWTGITKVRETPEFFLFFTTPSCAIQLPKRVVADVPALREWLDSRVARA